MKNSAAARSGDPGKLAVESGAMVTGWSVDSRTLQPGDLFFALRGPPTTDTGSSKKFCSKGALAVITDREVNVPTLRVEDSLKALQVVAGRRANSGAGDGRRDRQRR